MAPLPADGYSRGGEAGPYASDARARTQRPSMAARLDQEDEGKGSRGPAPGMERRRVDLAIPKELRRRAAPWAATCEVQAAAAMKVERHLCLTTVPAQPSPHSTRRRRS